MFLPWPFSIPLNRIPNVSIEKALIALAAQRYYLYHMGDMINRVRLNPEESSSSLLIQLSPHRDSIVHNQSSTTRLPFPSIPLSNLLIKELVPCIWIGNDLPLQAWYEELHISEIKINIPAEFQGVSPHFETIATEIEVRPSGFGLGLWQKYCSNPLDMESRAAWLVYHALKKHPQYIFSAGAPQSTLKVWTAVRCPHEGRIYIPREEEPC